MHPTNKTFQTDVDMEIVNEMLQRMQIDGIIILIFHHQKKYSMNKLLGGQNVSQVIYPALILLILVGLLARYMLLYYRSRRNEKVAKLQLGLAYRLLGSEYTNIVYYQDRLSNHQLIELYRQLVAIPTINKTLSEETKCTEHFADILVKMITGDWKLNTLQTVLSRLRNAYDFGLFEPFDFKIPELKFMITGKILQSEGFSIVLFNSLNIIHKNGSMTDMVVEINELKRMLEKPGRYRNASSAAEEFCRLMLKQVNALLNEINTEKDPKKTVGDWLAEYSRTGKLPILSEGKISTNAA